MRVQRSVCCWSFAATAGIAGCSGEVTLVCAPGDYPAAPEGATAVLHVSNECPSAEEDGSFEHPYQTIGAALAEAPPGAAVLIAPGSYPEHVKIEQDVALVGGSDPTRPDSARAVIAASAEPFTSCTDQPTTASVFVCGAHRAMLRGVRVEGASAAGIAAKTATLVVEGSVVEGVAKEDDRFGYGVLAADGATLVLRDSRVTGAAGIGVLVSEARAALERNELRDNLGPGVWLTGATGKVEVLDNAIEGNTQFGVAVVGSSAVLQRNTITDTTGTEDQPGSGHAVIGSALLPDGGGAEAPYGLELLSNELRDNAGAGVVLARGTVGFIVSDNLISANGRRGMLGGGVLIPQGIGASASNTIEGNTITGNRFLGIGVAGDTSPLLIADNVIDATTMGTQLSAEFASIDIGDGITVSARASARLFRNTVRGNERLGLIVDEANGSATTVEGNVFEGNGSFGVVLQNQQEAPTISNNEYRDNVRGDMASGSTEQFDVWRGDAQR